MRASQLPRLLCMPILLVLLVNLSNADRAKIRQRPTRPNGRQEASRPRLISRSSVVKCTPVDLAMAVAAPCAPLAVEVIYDSFRSRFPEGCMAPFPTDLVRSAISMDWAEVMKDEDVVWLITQIGDLGGGNHDQPGQQRGGQQGEQGQSGPGRRVQRGQSKRSATPDGDSKSKLSPLMKMSLKLAKRLSKLHRDRREAGGHSGTSASEWIRDNLNPRIQNMFENLRRARQWNLNNREERSPQGGRDSSVSDWLRHHLHFRRVFDNLRRGHERNDHHHQEEQHSNMSMRRTEREVEQDKVDDLLNKLREKMDMEMKGNGNMRMNANVDGHKGRHRINLFTDVCPRDDEFVHFAIENSRELGNSFEIVNETHVLDRNANEIVGFSELDLDDYNTDDIRSNYSRMSEMRRFQTFALKDRMTRMAMRALNISHREDMSNVFEDDYGDTLTLPELVNMLLEYKIIAQADIQERMRDSRDRFLDFILEEFKEELKREWNVMDHEGQVNGGRRYQLLRLETQEKFDNLTKRQLVKKIFEESEWLPCNEIADIFELKADYAHSRQDIGGYRAKMEMLLIIIRDQERQVGHMLREMGTLQRRMDDVIDEGMSNRGGMGGLSNKFSDVCPINDHELIHFAFTNVQEFNSSFKQINNTHVIDADFDDVLLASAALAETLEKNNITISDFKRNFTRMREERIFERFVLNDNATLTAMHHLNIFEQGSTVDAFKDAQGHSLTPSEVVDRLTEARAVNRTNAHRRMIMANHKFYDFVLEEVADNILREWNVTEYEDGDDGGSKYYIHVPDSDKKFYNLTKKELIRKVFEEYKSLPCHKIVEVYESLPGMEHSGPGGDRHQQDKMEADTEMKDEEREMNDPESTLQQMRTDLEHWEHLRKTYVRALKRVQEQKKKMLKMEEKRKDLYTRVISIERAIASREMRQAEVKLEIVRLLRAMERRRKMAEDGRMDMKEDHMGKPRQHDILSDVCHSDDLELIHYAFTNVETLNSKFEMLNKTHVVDKFSNETLLSSAALAEELKINPLSMSDIRSNHSRFREEKLFENFAIKDDMTRWAIHLMNISEIGDMADMFAFGENDNLTLSEIIKILIDSENINRTTMLLKMNEERDMFYDFLLNGIAAGILEMWNTTLREGEADGSMEYSIHLPASGDKQHNLTKRQLVKKVFEENAWLSCHGMIKIYRLTYLAHQETRGEGRSAAHMSAVEVERKSEMVKEEIAEWEQEAKRQSHQIQGVMREVEVTQQRIERADKEEGHHYSALAGVCTEHDHSDYIRFALNELRELNETVVMELRAMYDSLNETRGFDSLDNDTIDAVEMELERYGVNVSELRSEHDAIQQERMYAEVLVEDPHIREVLHNWNISWRLDNPGLFIDDEGENITPDDLVDMLSDSGITNATLLDEKIMLKMEKFYEYVLESLPHNWRVNNYQDANRDWRYSLTVAEGGRTFTGLTRRELVTRAIQQLEANATKSCHDLVSDFEQHHRDGHPPDVKHEEDMMLAYFGAIIKFLERKFIASADQCGPQGTAGVIKNLTSLTVFDKLTVFAPMFGYAKNSLMRKYMVPGKPIHTMLSEMIRQLFSHLEFEYIDLFAEPGVFAYRHFPENVKTFCKLSHTIGSCMDRVMRDAPLTACGARWKDIKPWINSIPVSLCVPASYGLKPSQPTLRVLEANYGYMFNFIECYLESDGSLPRLDQDGGRGIALLTTLEIAVKKCSIEKFSIRLEKKIVEFARSYEKRPMDIMRIVDFIQKLSASFASPLRCSMKTFHSVCAERKVDMALVMRQMLPMLDIGSFGMISIPVEKVDYSIKKNFKSIDRVTVMVVGDPHVKTLKSNSEYETCNELESFNDVYRDFQVESSADVDAAREEGLLAYDKTVLLSNEWFKVEATLARWSKDVNGTYFIDATISVVENLALYGREPASDIEYTYSAKTKDEDPTFTRVTMVPQDFGKPRREETILNNTVLIIGEDRKINLRISMQQVQGETRVVVNDRSSGTLVAFSNPSSDMVNVYVRSSRPLLELSSGLLIDGCPDALNRTEEVTKASQTRQRRALDCDQDCNAVDTFFVDMCNYDCLAAENSGINESMVAFAYQEIDDIVADVVELPAADQEMIEEAEEEEEVVAVETTTPKPEDEQASGGKAPVEGLNEALYAAVDNNFERAALVDENNGSIVDTTPFTEERETDVTDPPDVFEPTEGTELPITNPQNTEPEPVIPRTTNEPTTPADVQENQDATTDKRGNLKGKGAKHLTTSTFLLFSGFIYSYLI